MGLTIAPADSHDEDDKDRVLRADLKGFNEILTLSTTGRGSFRARINRHETEIEYRLNYSGLEAGVTQAHIHFGTFFLNGGISVWLCGTTPGFPGPASQGILPGEFAELIKAIRAGATYANVHTMKYPGGEIRGQIRADD